MTARNVSTIVHWDGEIIGSSTAVSYIGGEVMGIFVSEGINFTGLLEEMYDLTQWDRRVFSINIICRHPRGKCWEAYPIKNDAMTKWIFDPRNITHNAVELFLEKVERPMVDNFGERIGVYSDPPHSMATENVDGGVEEGGAGSSNENRVMDIDEVGVENLPSMRSVFSISNAPEEDTYEFENEIMASEAGEGEEDEDDDDDDDDNELGGVHDDDDDDVGGAHDDLPYEELLALGGQNGHVNTGLTEDTISKCLRTRTYEIDQESPVCVICQAEYEENEKLGCLECGHEYHVDCIKQWLLLKNTCPLCKNQAFSLDSKE